MISIKNVRSFCAEDPSLIENYEEAINSPKMYECHHRLEIDEDQEITFSKKELIDLGYYYNRPAKELIFLERRYHQYLHRLYNPERNLKISETIKGKHHTEETKRKISESCKGRTPVNKGKHLTNETRRKLSESHKGHIGYMTGKHHSEETKRKLSEQRKGENNIMYGKQHTKETKRKMSESHMGLHWYNNGIINKRAKECPEGFVKGQLKNINNKNTNNNG